MRLKGLRESPYIYVQRLQEAARRSFDSDARRSLQAAARSSRMPGMRRNRDTGPTSHHASYMLKKPLRIALSAPIYERCDETP